MVNPMEFKCQTHLFNFKMHHRGSVIKGNINIIGINELMRVIWINLDQLKFIRNTSFIDLKTE